MRVRLGISGAGSSRACVRPLGDGRTVMDIKKSAKSGQMVRVHPLFTSHAERTSTPDATRFEGRGLTH